MEEANHHCPEGTIKMLIGNKLDLLEQMNNSTKPINALDDLTWKVVAQEKLTNSQLSCKTYEGLELFWELLENNVRNILKKVKVSENPFKDGRQGADILPQPRQRGSLKTGSQTKLASRNKME